MFSHDTLNFFKTHLDQLNTNYLEIGVYRGESIRDLAIAFPNKTIIGVDPFIEDGNTTHDSMVAQGGALLTQRELTFNGIKNLTNVKFYEMTSEKFYKELTPSLIDELNVGSVYIDGSHWYDDVVVDYKLALDLIGKKSGIVCFDDLHIEGVVKACNEFITICGDRITRRIDLNISNSVFVLKAIA